MLRLCFRLTLYFSIYYYNIKLFQEENRKEKDVIGDEGGREIETISAKGARLLLKYGLDDDRVGIGNR